MENKISTSIQYQFTNAKLFNEIFANWKNFNEKLVRIAVVPLAGTWVEIGFLISLENIAFIDHHNVFTRSTRA